MERFYAGSLHLFALTTTCSKIHRNTTPTLHRYLSALCCFRPQHDPDMPFVLTIGTHHLHMSSHPHDEQISQKRAVLHNSPDVIISECLAVVFCMSLFVIGILSSQNVNKWNEILLRLKLI